MAEEKVVARFRDGKMVKGYVKDFQINGEAIVLVDQEGHAMRDVRIEELKALFFVKTFEGFHKYVEKKAFGIRRLAGCKVLVKFLDNEVLVGIIAGEIPWNKGFSLARLGEHAKGFFLTPVDGDSNNDKVFVVGSAIQDISIMKA